MHGRAFVLAGASAQRDGTQRRGRGGGQGQRRAGSRGGGGGELRGGAALDAHGWPGDGLEAERADDKREHG
eukprot:1870288-Prymnesium_polylepis.1